MKPAVVKSLEITGLTKEYGHTKAVDSITVSFKEGEIVGIVGPNGGGKTTLLRLIADLIQPTRGTIEITGDVPFPSRRQITAYLPDTPDLFPALTVWEHMKFIGLAYSLKDWERKAKKLLADFDLLAQRSRLAFELSKGMKQKLMLCVSLLASPALILFDEPFAGLDPMASRELKDKIINLKGTGRIILVSSHILQNIEDVCSRVIFLRNGSIIGDIGKESLQELLRDKEKTLEAYFMDVMGHAI